MVVNSSKVGPGPWDSFDETRFKSLASTAYCQKSSFKCEVSVEGHGSRTKGAETIHPPRSRNSSFLDLLSASTEMSSFQKILASFIDQLSQRYSDGVGLIRLRSCHIQRRLPSIEAAQGSCWTAPCSPAAPASAEQDLVSREDCRAQVQSWHSSLHAIVSHMLIILNL